MPLLFGDMGGYYIQSEIGFFSISRFSCNSSSNAFPTVPQPVSAMFQVIIVFRYRQSIEAVYPIL